MRDLTRTTVVLLSLLLLSACSNDMPDPSDTRADTTDTETIPFQQEGLLTFRPDTPDSLQIAIEIAETDSSRARGLMQRGALPDRSGMLFIFDQRQPLSFWMANTPLALDIIFVDTDSTIVDIAKYTHPFSPDQVASDEPGRFVIEVPAGFADTHGIVEADRVTWRRTPSPEAPL